MLKNLMISILLLLSINVRSQFCVNLHGNITDYFTGEGMRGVEVRVKNTDGIVGEGYTLRKGFYGFKLDSGEVYNLEIRKIEMVSKRLIIDTRGAICPDSLFYDMDLQVTLFKKIPNFDFSLFNIPLGMAKYDHGVRNMTWNNEYTNKVNPVLDETMQEYIKATLGYYERKDTIAPVTSIATLNDTIKDITINGGIMAFEADIDSSMTIKTRYNDMDSIFEVESSRGLFFTVQIGVYSKATDLKKKYDIKDINSEFIEEGKIRYTSGKFRGDALANSYKKQIIKLGIIDAFVTAYMDGKRIPLSRANEIVVTMGPDILIEEVK